MQNGIQDCSRGGAYHNKKFKDAAEARDLKISYDPRIGWSITEPTEALCEFVVSQGWDDINMNRIESGYAPRGKGAENATGNAIRGYTKKSLMICCRNLSGDEWVRLKIEGIKRLFLLPICSNATFLTWRTLWRLFRLVACSIRLDRPMR